MSSLRDLRQRIENVSSTKQIIKAMDMIASTKLQRVRAQLEGVRPIYFELKRLVKEAGNHSDAKTHVFYKERKVNSSLYIILTSDRGLSGSYNAKILAKAIKHMKDKNEKILAVGSKGYEYLKRRNKNIIRSLIDIADAQVYYSTESIANWVIDLYLSGEAEEVFIAYTHFESVLSYVPYVERILPIDIDHTVETVRFKLYEPDISSYIDQLIPLYIHMNLFRAFSESHTSEQAARMVNMDTAGKNAEEMLEKLIHIYNRKRQAAVTQELNEIVSGVNILNKGELYDS